MAPRLPDRRSARPGAVALIPLLAVLIGPTVAKANPVTRDESPAAGFARGMDRSGFDTEAVVLGGLVLVGIDDFGRVLIAVDERRNGRRDGNGDRYYLFDTRKPPDERWFRMLRNARLIESDGGVAIYSEDRSLAIRLNMETGTADLPPGPYREVRTVDGGVELTVATPERGSPAKPITSLDYRDISTWPDVFRPRPVKPRD